MRRAKKVSITVVALVVVCAVYVIHRNAVQERWREAHDDFIAANNDYQQAASRYRDCVSRPWGSDEATAQECYTEKREMDDYHAGMRSALAKYNKAADE